MHFSACGWLFLSFPISGLHRPPAPAMCPLVFPLRVSVSSSCIIHVPLHLFLLPPPICLLASPLPSLDPRCPLLSPLPDLRCPPPPLLGPTFLDTLPPVALEATSPSIFSSRRN